jgi:hypothetical protein
MIMTFVTKMLWWMLLLSVSTLMFIGMFGNLMESSLARLAGLCIGLSIFGLFFKLLDRPVPVRFDD